MREDDAIQALKNRVLEQRRHFEMKVAEANEFLRVLGDAPRILGEQVDEPQEHDKTKGTPVNKGLAKQVQLYLASLPYGEIVNRSEMIKTLKSDYGIRGKDSSLYAYLSGMLKKIAQDKDNTVQLRYKEGEGFFRERDKIDRNDSELVAQS